MASVETRTARGAGLWLLAALAAAGLASATAADVLFSVPSEADRPAPVDRGAGPGVRPRPPARAAIPGEVAAGGPDAHLAGVFGPPVEWPINPIHVALLPDGRLLNYGTDTAGNQGAGLVYDVWDPALGTGADAHLTLPNTTATDIFCSAQTVLKTGEVLITGGDRTVDGKLYYSENRTTLFSPAADAVRTGPTMAYPRWYPTVVTLASGNVLVLGGRQDPRVPATVPELYTPGVGYRVLPGAASVDAFGTASNWFYPRSFLAPSGRVVVVGNDGALFSLSTAFTGGIARLRASAPLGNVALPAAAFAPGKVLAVRAGARAVVVDIGRAQPAVTSTGSPSQERFWSTLTVLPDGKVLATGGSAVANQLTGVAYQAESWDPATGRWTLGASAAKPRLYHSTAILLPDATVLTAGGGAGGPVLNLNAEVYYPPYLFKPDGSGAPAARPSILDAPGDVHRGRPFAARVDGPVARVTLLRTGSVTHGLDAQARFLELAFAQTSGSVVITPPSDARLAPPGYYMLFVLDAAGVPSMARIVRLGA